MDRVEFTMYEQRVEAAYVLRQLKEMLRDEVMREAVYEALEDDNGLINWPSRNNQVQGPTNKVEKVLHSIYVAIDENFH